MNNKIFITGSCGFLFSNFIRKVIYNKLNYKIFSIDCISNNVLNNVYQNKNHSFYIGNCNDNHLLDIIFLSDNPDIIIHGAFENNLAKDLEITAKLLEKSKGKRFIFISSSDVYGFSNNKLTEDSDLAPESNEGINKLLCENLVIDYCTIHKIDYNIIRVGKIFGPRQSKSNLFVNAINNFKNKNTIELNYNNTYSFGYVSDAVNGVLKVLDSGKNTEIYNLGSFSASEFDVLCSIQNKLNLEEELIIQNNTNKKSCIINCDKLNNIGWSVEQNLEDSVSMFTQWYLNNNWWFK